MKKQIAILSIIGAIIYGTSAYTRPHEPAGRALHAAIDNLPKVELPRIPFSGLLRIESEYEPRPTLQTLETVPASATPYTAAELAEIYPSH